MNKLRGISFFCPAYHDAENIPAVVKRCVEVFPEVAEDYEIIVVNDGSPDNTAEVGKSLEATYDKVRFINHEKNLGYAEALRTGFKNAKKFDHILFTDGDNQYDVGYLTEMLKYIDDYDAIITYRTKNANSLIRRFVSRAFNITLNVLFREPYKDLSSSFRLIRRSALENVELKSDGILLAVELILKLHKAKLKIKEVPIESKKRLHGSSSSLLPKNFLGLIWDMLLLKWKEF